MTRSLGFALAALLLAGCGFTDIHQWEMAPRLEYASFSFARPESPDWFIRRSEAAVDQVVIRRGELSGVHSAYVMGQLTPLKVRLNDQAELAGWMQDQAKRHSGDITIISYAQEPLTLQNQACITSRTEADVRNSRVAPDETLRMTTHVITCLHPSHRKAVVEAMFSERGRPGDLDPAIAAEGEAILNTFQIDVAPGEPAH